MHGLEINISCPNVKHGCDFAVDPALTAELIAAVRRVTDLTLITKLSPNVTDLVPIARAAVDAGSDALSLINTLLGTAIDIRRRKFRLANITGGLSGPAVKPVALRCVWQVHRALPQRPPHRHGRHYDCHRRHRVSVRRSNRRRRRNRHVRQSQQP